MQKEEYSQFPLYSVLDNYVSSINFNEDLTHEKKIEILKCIKNLNCLEQKYLFIIIKIYSLKCTESLLLDIPYKGVKVDETKFTFDLDVFPNKLKHMIYKFCELQKK